MKNINDNIELPFVINVGFNKLLEHYEELAESNDEFIAAKARRVLKTQKPHPLLREGFKECSYFKTYEKEINIILQDSFSEVLTKNEIKTASVPFHNLVFNSSERFKNIIKDAGDNFELEISNMPDDARYIIACTIILKIHFGYESNYNRPLYFEIPDANGMMRYYKILYNADFVELFPTENAPKITDEDYQELLDNFDDLELWKSKFPPQSYIFKGFVISNLFDITLDHSISNIKSSLIGKDKRKDNRFMSNFQSIFKTFFNLNELEVGFSIYDKEENELMQVYDAGIGSFLLETYEVKGCKKAFCSKSYQTLFNDKTFYSVSDIDAFKDKEKAPHIYTLYKQGYKSAILAPIADGNELLGILELVSTKKRALNSIAANKLLDVMPYIVAAVKRSKIDEENLIEAIIQRECTSIHPSVHWKFAQAARKYLVDKNTIGEKVSFKKIVFKNVYPLFGQIDVKGSSEARNNATQKDLALQLMLVNKIIDKALETENLPVFEKLKFQIDEFTKELNLDFKVDSEQRVTAFFKNEIDPLLRFKLEKSKNLKEDIENYFSKIDTDLNVIYYYRKNFDDTLMLINKNMSALLDEKQIEAQQMYPHFFERYKTDGVEHNMYIGESITKEESFNEIYLYNLRLWQLQVMCEMENEYYTHQDEYPLALDVASMILVFNQPLSIRFRMDEKHFDVDGTYNARYEVVKKRVDKANIKGTNERATAEGKITIVYSQKEDEIEYLQYIKFLQSKKVLDSEIEIVELEDLQGVTGLKAIRVNILYTDKEKTNKAFYTYNDLMKEIKA